MPLIVAVADAVVAELNYATFSQTFQAERWYAPRRALGELTSLAVSVVPAGLTVQAGSRAQSQEEVSIDVAVQQKLTQESLAHLDPLLALTEEIAAHFRGKRLTPFPEAVWVKTEFPAIYAPEHLDQFRVFTSVIRLTFRILQ